MEKEKIIQMKMKMADPKGKLIPRGIQEQLTVQIADETVIYFFKDSRITKNFATVEIEGDKAKGIKQKTFYLGRSGKALTQYPGKKKEEIQEIILEQLNQLGINCKK